MIHEEGLIHIEKMINGSEQAAPLVLHLYAPDFVGYQPIILNQNWFKNDDGYMQHNDVCFTLSKKETVGIEGCYIAFNNGIKLYSEMFDTPRFLFYYEDKILITPRYKLTEQIELK